MPKDAPRTRFGEREDKIILEVLLNPEISERKKTSTAAEIIKKKFYPDNTPTSVYQNTYQRAQKILEKYKVKTFQEVYQILTKGTDKIPATTPGIILSTREFPEENLAAYDREIQKARDQIKKMYFQREKVIANYMTAQADAIKSYSQYMQFAKMSGEEIAALDVDSQKEFINFMKNKEGYVKKLDNIDLVLVNTEGPGKILFPFYSSDVATSNSKAQSVIFNGTVYLFKELFKDKPKPFEFHGFASAEFKTSLSPENVQDLGTKLNELTANYPFLSNTRINFNQDNSGNYSFLQGGQ